MDPINPTNTAADTPTSDLTRTTISIVDGIRGGNTPVLPSISDYCIAIGNLTCFPKR